MHNYCEYKAYFYHLDRLCQSTPRTQNNQKARPGLSTFHTQTNKLLSQVRSPPTSQSTPHTQNNHKARPGLSTCHTQTSHKAWPVPSTLHTN